MSKAIGWFEIPATDLNCAEKLYETILGVKLNGLNMGGQDLGVSLTTAKTAQLGEP